MYFFLKRLIDITLSLLGIILLSPIIIIILVLQFFYYGNKIFFNQKRVGFKGKIFKVFKFKTMIEKQDKDGNLLPDNLRITKFGKFMRSFSLDEIPQLLNIFLGDMSIVGPRPQSIEICLFMTKEQFKRHQIKPGLTGLSAIKGRNGISWENKILYDLEYLNKKNIFLDIKIIFITAYKVLIRENVFSEGNISSTSLGEELLSGNKISRKVFEKRFVKIKALNNRKYFLEKDLILINEN